MKKVLLIGGGGTLGTYAASELLDMGHKVDIICLEDYTSDNEQLTYYRAKATMEYLTDFLKERYYDAIINFLCYSYEMEYPLYHELLSEKTKQLVFLSSYRVYADLEHPITEEAPHLADVLEDASFFKKEGYARPKSVCEKYIRHDSCHKNWTIVRPVISFSERRMDLVLYNGLQVVEAAKEGRELVLPLEAKNLTAGIDWAGNTAKQIVHLLFKEETLGEAYTISTAQNLTWGEVSEIYTELLGSKFRWEKADYPGDAWYWYYDRAYDRAIDNSKVLRATGLTQNDFKSIRDGIEIELRKLGAI